MLQNFIALANSMPWWAASLLSNACIMAVEYLNHAGGYGSFTATLLRTGPLIIVAQWGLYRAFSCAEHWLIAWAVFTIGNSVMRVAAVYVTHSHQVGNWFQAMTAVSIMIGGAYLLKGALK